MIFVVKMSDYTKQQNNVYFNSQNNLKEYIGEPTVRLECLQNVVPTLDMNNRDINMIRNM